MTGTGILARLPFALALIFLPSVVRALDKPNILFIIVDDLNWVDVAPSHTPNLDRLLAVSTEFKGYPNFPWCNPSRCSLFAGLRPEAIGIYDLDPFPRVVLPNRYWLPQGINDSG
jgi:arylsulfatase A-like enzyme